MKITIVGGGNIGTQLAVHCAAKQHDVTIFTSKPGQFEQYLCIVDESGNITCEGKIQLATNDEKIAFSEADMILITLPAYCMEEISKKIERYSKSDAMIGLIPGTGGGECCFIGCLNKGCIVFGLQRVPSVARLVTYGKKVCATGYRPELFLAAIPQEKTKICCHIMTKLLDMPTNPLPNYLNVTLTPSNPILHTTRLYTLFKEYEQGKQYDYIPLFYEEWDDASSELLLKCDEEVQQLCKNMKEFDLSYVKSLKVHYESTTVQALTKKLRSIDSLKGLPTPTVGKEHQLIPDFSSRYFTADFPYGLEILHQIACFVDIFVPHMTKVLQWYYQLTQNPQKFQYSQYGIYDYQSFKNFYLR
ncbi:MAG: NAD(P)-binding domain-containing protein [Lachnospiraceae bacterium]|nr:NAD(P)-binding domain-containing protein [Lachnospiraceae bacterium]